MEVGFLLGGLRGEGRLFSRDGVFGGLALWLGWAVMRLRWGVGEWRMEWVFGEWCSWAVSDWVIAASRGGNATATAYRFRDDMDTDTDTDTGTLTDQCDSLRFGMSDDRAMHGFGKMAFFEDGQAVSCGLFGMSDNRPVYLLRRRTGGRLKFMDRMIDLESVLRWLGQTWVVRMGIRVELG